MSEELSEIERVRCVCGHILVAHGGRDLSCLMQICTCGAFVKVANSDSD